MKDDIIKCLKNIHEAKTLIEINDLLNLTSVEELQELTRNLEELVNEYIIFKTKKDKYILLENCPSLKIGKIAINKKGFGFLIINEADDIYIPQENLNNAIHNDIVLIEVIKNGLAPVGKVLKVVKRDLNNIVGEVVIRNNKVMLKPDDSKIDLTIYLSDYSSKNCVDGHKVLAKLSKNLGSKTYLADCIKILGHKDDAGIDILSIAIIMKDVII